MDNFDEIIDFYENNTKNLNFQNEIRLKNYSEIQICLCLLLNLFFASNLDLFNNIGKSLEELTIEKKKNLIEILKSEIMKKDS